MTELAMVFNQTCSVRGGSAELQRKRGSQRGSHLETLASPLPGLVSALLGWRPFLLYSVETIPIRVEGHH